MNQNTNPLAEFDLEQTADRCVKCGLCLPHCPTYQLKLDEGESPRGRISLIQGLLQNKLEPSKTLLGHLDRCLGCRACESMCPSNVAFGSLMDQARQLTKAAQPRPHWLVAKLFDTLKTPGALKKEAKRLQLLKYTGLAWLSQRLGLFKPLRLLDGHSLIQKIDTSAFKAYYPVIGQEQKRIGLFLGCFSQILDNPMLKSAITLLNHCGYSVYIPPTQGCCGGLHQHTGDLTAAATMAERNVNAFNALELDAIAYSASGCGASLLDYDALYTNKGLQAPVIDINRLLVEAKVAQKIDFAPLKERVIHYTPCTQRNVIHDDATKELLSAIDCELIELKQTGCCGAAGSYLMTQPEMSVQLREPLIDAIVAHKANILVTTNIGCALQLQAGLQKRKYNTEVVHPVTLLARQARL